MTAVSIHPGIPDDARALIWESFFREPGRGVTFERHLPWHAGPSVRTITVREADDLVAAAVLRPAPQPGVAMIGYVCVAAALRGRGYGRVLMAAVGMAADEQSYKAILLWTSKPAVYAAHGYDVIERDRFVRVMQRAASNGDVPGFRQEPWPGSSAIAGLPAFATSATRYWNDGAEAIVATGPKGATLVSWDGKPLDVAALAGAAGHMRWSTNLSPDDPFLRSLPADRFDISIDDGAFTMARRFDLGFVPAHVAVLDRI
ncbi:GNAT family N-acetyltransferase [Sphingomonas hankookensis]|uniref:N-acetyltransferase domain-containing protein n=1 Tax=Sphingomonas hankookensis TaxID=563996 RepID=A0ABR5YCB9_9SPHN|nr:GNAT family N-acetyltransferase [Sphingomonas hankookensis]KZE13286.1 hypothetical protein AVT10_03705 [Sphingomonas hankookensis]